MSRKSAIASLTDLQRAELFCRLRRRDGDNCMLCHLPLAFKYTYFNCSIRPTVDHIIPLSANGSDDDSNLRLVHSFCNSARHGPADCMVWIHSKFYRKVIRKLKVNKLLSEDYSYPTQQKTDDYMASRLGVKPDNPMSFLKRLLRRFK